MALRKEKWIGFAFVCDECGAPDPVGYKTLEYLVAQARIHGWEVVQDAEGNVLSAVCPCRTRRAVCQ